MSKPEALFVPPYLIGYSAGCGLWYRRRSGADGYNALKGGRQSLNDKNRRGSGADEHKALKVGRQILNDDNGSCLAIVNFDKRKIDPEEEEDVASFKRVRMVSLPSLFGFALDKVSVGIIYHHTATIL